MTDADPAVVEPSLRSPAQPLVPEGFSLREIVATVWRRKGLLLATVVVVAGAAAAALQMVTPRYTATTLIAVAGDSLNVVEFNEVVAGLSGDAETLGGEVQLLRSRDMAWRAVNALGLDRDREFNGAAGPRPLSAAAGGWSARIDSLVSEARALLGELLGRGPPGGDESPASDPATTRTRLVDKFLSRLDVSQVKGSRVIAVEFTSEEAAKAAEVANTVADLYVADQLAVKRAANAEATAWLDARVEELREKVEAADTEVARFRQRSRLLRGNEGTLIAQQFTELNTQLILAKAVSAEAGARLAQTRELLNSPGGIESAGEVLNSELIQSLRSQEAGLQRRVAELSGELGRLHPRMVNLQAEVASLQSKIRAEIGKITRGLENEVAIARARQESLQASVDELQGSLAQANRDEVRLQALEREAEANRLLLSTFLARLKETSTQADGELQRADARIISRADVPVRPSFPATKPILALALAAGALLGLLLVFVREHFDQGLRSGEQVEHLTGVPALGFVPLLRGFGRARKRPWDYLLVQPRSAFAESINTLRWSLGLARERPAPHSILITSALPKEGKTTVAVCLARSCALAGQKTLLIDADSRIPGATRAFRMRKGPGLMNLLVGEVALNEVLWVDEATGLHILQAGKASAKPGDALGGAGMQALLDDVRERYDRVIVDSPPVLAVADALIVGARVDATVFVVRWAKTRREAVSLSLRRIVDAGGTPAGVLMSAVDVRKYAGYGYGDSGAYYGRLNDYYTG